MEQHSVDRVWHRTILSKTKKPPKQRIAVWEKNNNKNILVKIWFLKGFDMLIKNKKNMLTWFSDGLTASYYLLTSFLLACYSWIRLQIWLKFLLENCRALKYTITFRISGEYTPYKPRSSAPFFHFSKN